MSWCVACADRNHTHRPRGYQACHRADPGTSCPAQRPDHRIFEQWRTRPELSSEQPPCWGWWTQSASAGAGDDGPAGAERGGAQVEPWLGWSTTPETRWWMWCEGGDDGGNGDKQLSKKASPGTDRPATCAAEVAGGFSGRLRVSSFNSVHSPIQPAVRSCQYAAYGKPPIHRTANILVRTHIRRCKTCLTSLTWRIQASSLLSPCVPCYFHLGTPHGPSRQTLDWRRPLRRRLMAALISLNASACAPEGQLFVVSLSPDHPSVESIYVPFPLCDSLLPPLLTPSCSFASLTHSIHSILSSSQHVLC